LHIFKQISPKKRFQDPKLGGGSFANNSKFARLPCWHYSRQEIRIKNVGLPLVAVHTKFQGNPSDGLKVITDGKHADTITGRFST
jgi:hypothetical protein